MGDEQVWKVAVTPAQRFILVNLSHAEGQKVKGQRSRVYRRFNRAFGLSAILDAADSSPEGKINGKLSLDRTPSLFLLTAENVDYALDLVEVERSTVVDRTIGPLFDVLDDIKAKRPYEEPAGVPEYEATSEDWAPQRRAKAAPIEQRIADYLRAQGEVKAAELVDRGGWDQPASTNGTPASQPEERPEA